MPNNSATRRPFASSKASLHQCPLASRACVHPETVCRPTPCMPTPLPLNHNTESFCACPAAAMPRTSRNARAWKAAVCGRPCPSLVNSTTCGIGIPATQQQDICRGTSAPNNPKQSLLSTPRLHEVTPMNHLIVGRQSPCCYEPTRAPDSCMNGATDFAVLVLFARPPRYAFHALRQHSGPGVS